MTLFYSSQSLLHKLLTRKLPSIWLGLARKIGSVADAAAVTTPHHYPGRQGVAKKVIGLKVSVLVQKAHLHIFTIILALPLRPAAPQV